MHTFKTTVLLYATFLTSPVFAAPQRAGEAVETVAPPFPTGTPTSNTFIHDIVDSSHPTEAVKVTRAGGKLKERMEQPPEHLTIEIVNAYGQYLGCVHLAQVIIQISSKKLKPAIGQEITTAHASNAGSPTPVGGPIEPGIVPNGTTASFAVPTGWAGNVAMNRANMSITGDVTLLEASFIA